MLQSLFRVQRVSDRRWLGTLGSWTPWEEHARTFSNRFDAEREARSKADGDYKIIEYLPNPLSR